MMKNTYLFTNFIQKWILNCSLGEFLGIFCAAALAVIGNHFIGEPNDMTAKILLFLIALASGMCEGTLLAYFQYRVLRHILPNLKFKQWWQYTIIPAVIGWALGILPSLTINNNDLEPPHDFAPPPLILIILGAAAMGLFLGGFFGWIQSLALKQHIAEVRSWILWNVVGWSLGMVWIFLAATIPDENTPTWLILTGGLIGGALAGLSVGVATSNFIKTHIIDFNI